MPESEASKMIMPPPFIYDRDKQLASELMDVASKLMAVASKLLNPPLLNKDDPPMPLRATKKAE